jgi:hypothetical protein
VLSHLLRNGDEVRSANGEPVLYVADAVDPGAMPARIVCDFGVLSIHQHASSRICVVSHGHEVLAMTPDAVEKLESGAWVAVLAAIAADLDARFGARRDRQRHLH